ncbi:MAG: ribonuclease III [Ignavibacteriales bacterium]|nr:ribonuclease III [Ignavibacteriales bacterium]
MIRKFFEKIFNSIRNSIDKTENYFQFFADYKIKIEKLIGEEIINIDYYRKAFTHRSYLEFLPKEAKSNERLEFLGDSILSFIVAEYLFNNYPDEDEGFLTKSRAYFVNRNTLANVAGKMKLEKFLIYDKRYKNDNHFSLKTILSDTIEAFIGAIYFDLGLDKTKAFVFKWIIKPNLVKEKFKDDTNYKGQLLELTHSLKINEPKYNLVEEMGPDHDKQFKVSVIINNVSYALGLGKKIKDAEQSAAKEALKKLRKGR